VLEVGVEGLAEEVEDSAFLLTAGRKDRPDALAPLLSAFASRALGDVAVDHNMPNRLFGLIVRRLNPRRGQEAKVIVRLDAAKPLCPSSRA